MSANERAKPVGSLLFVLHSHLPYVMNHGRWPHGTDWICEAAAETYLPLLEEINRLAVKGIRANITIGITPVLAEQLAHPKFAEEFDLYLQNKIEASYSDEQHFQEQGFADLAELTRYWRDWFSRVKHQFDVRYERNIIGAFRMAQESGLVEIMTSGATHGYMPLLGFDSTIQGQIKQGVQTYQRHFGCNPRSFWLPECAYRPRYLWSYPVQPKSGRLQPYLRKGVEEFLGENGLRVFFVENHLLLGATAASRRPTSSAMYSGEALEGLKLADKTEPLYQPYYVQTEGSQDPVAVFGRDNKTANQVWSAWEGYPGDGNYLDFHKKRLPGALRYWSVTGPRVDMNDKQRYIPEAAAQRVAEHARHFVELTKKTARDVAEKTGKPPVICAPYDTELFGHWWFEGVSWLGQVLEAFAEDGEIELRTVSESLDRQPPAETVRLPEGSWGEGGFHHVWLNPETSWTWELVYEAEARMHHMAMTYRNREDLEPLLKQCARELLLMTASDWQFNISTGGSVEYSRERLQEHYERFQKLAGITEKKAGGQEPSEEDVQFYRELEWKDNIFPDIDPGWFGALEHPISGNLPATTPTIEAVSPNSPA